MPAAEMLPLPTPVASTAWLAAAIGQPGLVVVDASWYLPQQGRDAMAEFRTGHIPGARFFDLDAASDPGSDLPHMLPTPEHFARYMTNLGIDAGSRVVVYDGSGIQLSAPRLWWMLRVFGHTQVTVLDGGIKAWRDEGRPLEAGDPPPAAGSAFRPGWRAELVRTRAEVQEAVASGSAPLGDARSTGRFVGRDPEPRAGLQAGHIPGSRSLPFTELVDPTSGRYLPVSELRNRLVGAGLSADRPAILMCGSGVTACSLAVAMQLAGFGEAAIYDGSWSDWGRDGAVASGGPSQSP